MRSFLVHVGRAAAVCALLVASNNAHAQGDAPRVSPPRLTRFVQADDPRTTPIAERATVELELDVDREGRVTNARVVQSAGPELDEAAVTAAKSFVFEPATRDGAPMAARIRYEYVFAAKAPPPPPVAPASKPAAIAGVALDVESGKPIANAKVVVTTDAGETFETKTDAAGAFRVEPIPAGPVHVVVTAEGRVPARLDETLEPATLTEAKLRLEPKPDPEAFGATARVEAPPREVTKRSLSREELTRVPGTRGDPIRAVELLPGVGRSSPTGDSNPILRGAKGSDSQVFAEGAPVPFLFHLGGLTSFAHSRVLDSVELYPSNFSVRYGRKAGGVIDVRFRDPRTDKLHGMADISLLDSSLVVETPLGEKLSFLGAARRSNIDAVLNSAANSADLAINSAPVYWDYQAITAFKPTDEDRFRLLAFGSSDRMAIFFKKPADFDPGFRGSLEQSSIFHRIQLAWRHRFHGGSEHNTEITYGYWKQRGVFGPLGNIEYNNHSIQGRSEFASVISPALRVTGGLDVLGSVFNGFYDGIPPTSGEGDQPMSLSTQKKVRIDTDNYWNWTPGAYLEAGIRPVPRLLLTPGVRADYAQLVDKASLDPRFSTRWDVTDMTAIKGGVGQFTQQPLEPEAVAPIGNPNLGLTKALHASAGVEQKITPTISVSGEGFAKWVDDVVTNTADGQAPFFDNSQKARIFGGELLFRVKPTGRFFGFVSYTLMRSERRDMGQDWRLFDRDTPHILNGAAVYRLGRGWEIGASLRYTSGTPYTPVASATYDATTDVYQARLGKSMSARNPAFSRLDVRVEKKWTFSLWSLAVYLDVQNVLNSPNREGFQYSYDYRVREGVRGLPIFPALGLRGEL